MKLKRHPVPHNEVYVRLKPSSIHGIGVFAIRNIPKDTNLFADDTSEIVWRKRSELKLDKLPSELRRLYNEFCLIRDKGERYGSPKSFNLLTVSWYLNHSEHPNVGCDEDDNFFALRAIKEGEELTADYHTYNDFATDDWV